MDSIDGYLAIQGASDELRSYVCGPCNFRETERRATSYCSDCEELLCLNCADSHGGYKSFKNHKLASLENTPSELASGKVNLCNVRCDCSHNTEVVLYCEEHGDVICQSCKLVQHRRCKTIPVSEKGAHFTKTELVPVAENATEMITEIDKFIEETTGYLLTLAGLISKCKNEVKKFRKEIDEFLDLVETNMVMELDDLEIKEKESIERHIYDLSTAKQMLQRENNRITTIGKSADRNDLFAAVVKISKRLKQYERMIKDFGYDVKVPTVIFEKNKELNELKDGIKAIGSVKVIYNPVSKQKRVLFSSMHVDVGGSVEVRSPGDANPPEITGCAFMQDGQVILCDSNNNRIKILKRTFTLRYSLCLGSRPWDVSAAGKDIFIVTLPDIQQLQFIEMAARIEANRSLKLDKSCWGVEVAGEKIYITCHDGGINSIGEVRILGLDGTVERRIGLSERLFTYPFYIAVNAKSRKAYVSDRANSTLTCFKLLPRESVVYKYRDKDLDWLRGMCVDFEDNIIACGEQKCNIQVINANGEKYRTLMSSKDSKQYPYCVSYTHRTNTLIIGSDKLHVYNTK